MERTEARSSAQEGFTLALAEPTKYLSVVYHEDNLDILG